MSEAGATEKKVGRPYRGDYGQGYKKGHPCYYRGGAVKGHAPTSDGKHLPHGHLRDPNHPAFLNQFDQPKGRVNQEKGQRMQKQKTKERECLEAIQNGTPDEKLVAPSGRYPARMVARLRALLDASEDQSHKFFIQSQQLVREILSTRKGGAHDDAEAAPEAAQAMEVHVYRGRIDVPMPGLEPPKDSPGKT